MGSVNSTVNIQLDGTQPFIMGQQITGTMTFNNTSEKNIKIQKISAEFIGKTLYTTYVYNGSGYHPVTHRDIFFEQSIPLIENQVRRFSDHLVIIKKQYIPRMKLLLIAVFILGQLLSLRHLYYLHH